MLVLRVETHCAISSRSHSGELPQTGRAPCFVRGFCFIARVGSSFFSLLFDSVALNPICFGFSVFCFKFEDAHRLFTTASRRR